MSVKEVSQLVKSLQDILLQVDGQTRPETHIADHSHVKRTYVDWVETAQATRQAATNATPELPKLEQLALALQYRTHLLKEEAPAELEPLRELFRILSEKLFPQGIPQEFADKQIRHLCTAYPAAAKKLVESGHRDQAENFFKFCLQAPAQSHHRGKDVSNWVDIFIKYPEVTERLMESSLYEKLGQFPESIFIHAEKGVCLKMELWDGGAWVPIHLKKESLDATWCFRNKALKEKTPGLTLTLEEIFKQFEGPLPGDLDVSMHGIINLNSTLLESRTSEEKVYPIDPSTWIETRPSVELTWPELIKLHPEAKDEPPFALILRANSLTPKNSQAFFDFILKLDNGNYRIMSLQPHPQPGTSLYQQKKVFYPLDDQQGKKVICMVAEHIRHCREIHAEEKPIPAIDIQSYVDEILGHTFYAHLQKLVSDLYPYNLDQTKEELRDQLSQVRKNLDTAAFEKFLRPVIDKLMIKHDIDLIHQFITTSLSTIYAVLQKDGNKRILPSVQEVTEACKHHFDQMNPSLLALASLCFEVLHPYRMTVAAAEKDTPILGLIFRAIEAIPWVWLKNLLYDFLLVILGPFRGYHYKTLETSHQKTLPKLAQTISNLKPERYINRPSQLFASYTEERLKLIDTRLMGHLAVLTASLNH